MKNYPPNPPKGGLIYSYKIIWLVGSGLTLL